MLKTCPFCGIEICWPDGDLEPDHCALCEKRKEKTKAPERDPNEDNFFDGLNALDAILEETNAPGEEIPESESDRVGFSDDVSSRRRGRPKRFRDPDLEEGAAVADDLEGAL